MKGYKLGVWTVRKEIPNQDFQSGEAGAKAGIRLYNSTIGKDQPLETMPSAEDRLRQQMREAGREAGIRSQGRSTESSEQKSSSDSNSQNEQPNRQPAPPVVARAGSV